MAYLIRLAALPHAPWEARCLRCGGQWLAALLFAPVSPPSQQILQLGPGAILPPMQCPHCRQNAGELEGVLETKNQSQAPGRSGDK